MPMSSIYKTLVVTFASADVCAAEQGDHVSLLQTGAAIMTNKADRKSESAWLWESFRQQIDDESVPRALLAQSTEVKKTKTSSKDTAPIADAEQGPASTWFWESFVQHIDQEQPPSKLSAVSTKKQVVSTAKSHGSSHNHHKHAHAQRSGSNETWLTLDSVHGEKSMSKRAKEAASKYRERANKARESDTSSFVHGNLQDPIAESDIPSCTKGIDFSRARLTHNNLGGHGPDDGEPTMVFSNIAQLNGKVNLEITALSDYKPRNTANNALRSQFGVINLETGTSATLRFTFIDDETGDYIQMPAFYFSFFDLDHGGSHASRESVDVKGFNTFSVTANTEVQVDRRDTDDASFVSSMRGNRLDNPLMSQRLDQLQQERTVSMLFPAGLTHFDVTLREVGYVHVQGRNFFFAGPSSLVCNEQETCALFLCPNGYKRRMNAEFTMCRGSHECNDQEDLDMCCLVDADSK